MYYLESRVSSTFNDSVSTGKLHHYAHPLLQKVLSTYVSNIRLPAVLVSPLIAQQYNDLQILTDQEEKPTIDTLIDDRASTLIFGALSSNTTTKYYAAKSQMASD